MHVCVCVLVCDPGIYTRVHCFHCYVSLLFPFLARTMHMPWSMQTMSKGGGAVCRHCSLRAPDAAPRCFNTDQPIQLIYSLVYFHLSEYRGDMALLKLGHWPTFCQHTHTHTQTWTYTVGCHGTTATTATHFSHTTLLLYASSIIPAGSTAIMYGPTVCLSVCTRLNIASMEHTHTRTPT
jgi:hypothetical protein